MVLSKFPKLAVLALALASPALACVQYSCNLNYSQSPLYKVPTSLGMMLTPPVDNGLFNAALTDNGGQTCQLTNKYVGLISADNYFVELSCRAGYSASFNFDTGVVTYRYSNFDGSFGTTTSSYQNNDGIYFSANVWGC